MTESIVEVLGKLRSVGIVFDDVALGCLAQLRIATQIVILEKIREYVFNPSLLLMSIIELEQTPRGAQKCGTVAIDAPDNKTPSAVAGPDQEQDEGCTGSAENAETSKPSYLMCQPELGVGGCSQVVRACHAGAAVPHDVEYALSLCGGEMVYLTVRRVRDVESFPWELPAGWYALHAAPHELLEPLQLKVAGTGITIPSILPTGCIVAVIRLGNPRPCKEFDGAQWALGQWCQAIEDVLMLQSCVASPMDYLRRVWILPEEIRSQVLACIPSVKGKPVSDATKNVATVHPAQGCETVMCKRPRLQSLLHASFPSAPPSRVDRLQKLYPHPRDKDCYLDDNEQKYFVHGGAYSLSVSGWWTSTLRSLIPHE